jgi:hypothetical protein
LVLTCPKFLTTSEYAPRLRARLETEKVLIQDARQRGWEREVERHQATSRRLEQLLSEVAPNGGGGTNDDGVSQSPSSRQEDNRVLSKPFE